MKNYKVIFLIFMIIFFVSCTGNKSENEYIWKKITPTNIPEARWGHHFVYSNIAKKAIFFGGYTNKADDGTFEFKLDTNSFNQIQTKGDVEALTGKYFKCYDYNIANINGEKLIRFGGLSENDEKLNITWEYDILKEEWRLHFTDGMPPARHSSNMVYFADNRLIMFGGQSEDNSFLNDLWEYDISDKKWSKISPNGDIPQARGGHTLTYIGDYKIIMFGGQGVDNLYYSELWQYNILDNSWKRVDNITIEANEKRIHPPARAKHSASYIKDGNKIIVFFGFNGDYLGDIWEYDIASNVWIECNKKGTKPPARMGHSTIYLENRYVLLFGGKSNSGNLNDVWTYYLDELKSK